jgi:hypothetical protein
VVAVVTVQIRGSNRCEEFDNMQTEIIKEDTKEYIKRLSPINIVLFLFSAAVSQFHFLPLKFL